MLVKGIDDWTIMKPFLQVCSWHVNRDRRGQVWRNEGEDGGIKSEQEIGACKEEVKRVDIRLLPS